MSIPLTGVLLIPLGLILACLPWRHGLAGLMMFAMLSPAAVVNFGGFGLQPGYYLAILLVGRTAAEIMVGRFRLDRATLGAMRPILYFTIVAFVVLFLALCFFQGQVETLPGSSGFKSALTQPFRLGRENFTQMAYLLLNLCLVYAMGHHAAGKPLDQALRDWDRAVVCGLCFAALICVWQFVSLYAGLFFPGDFFYSNAGYNRADSQSMVGLFRINGPFEEPSTLGYTFTGFVAFAWARYRMHPTPLTVAMIAAAIFCMVVSTSTTAVFGLGLFGALVAYDVATGRIHLMSRDFRLSGGQIAAIAIFAVMLLGGSLVLIENWQAIQLIVNNVVVNKAQSTSFQQRSFADALALRIVVDTFGLGVGLGSHKANSMLLTLLSNVGFFGTLLFGAFVFAVLRPFRAGLARRDGTGSHTAVRPFQLGAIGLVLVHVFSNPNLSVLSLWLALGGLLALRSSWETGPAAATFKSCSSASRTATAARRSRTAHSAGHPLAS